MLEKWLTEVGRSYGNVGWDGVVRKGMWEADCSVYVRNVEMSTVLIHAGYQAPWD